MITIFIWAVFCSIFCNFSAEMFSSDELKILITIIGIASDLNIISNLSSKE